MARKREYFTEQNGQIGFRLGDHDSGNSIQVMLYDVGSYYESLILFINIAGDIARLRGLATGLSRRDERELGQRVPAEVRKTDERLNKTLLTKFDGSREKLKQRIVALTNEAGDYLVAVEHWARLANCGFTHDHGRQLFYGLVESLDRRRYFRRTIRADLNRMRKGKMPVLYTIYTLEYNYQQLLIKRQSGKVHKKAPV